MPTNRRRLTRSKLADLTPFQREYLLDSEELPELDAEATWWAICQAHHSHPRDGYHASSAYTLWRRHRDDLMPLWRERHSDRPHPLDQDPPQLPAHAEGALRVLLEQAR